MRHSLLCCFGFEGSVQTLRSVRQSLHSIPYGTASFAGIQLQGDRIVVQHVMLWMLYIPNTECDDRVCSEVSRHQVTGVPPV